MNISGSSSSCANDEVASKRQKSTLHEITSDGIIVSILNQTGWENSNSIIYYGRSRSIQSLRGTREWNDKQILVGRESTLKDFFHRVASSWVIGIDGYEKLPAILTNGKSGAGKTFLLSHLVMKHQQYLDLVVDEESAKDTVNDINYISALNSLNENECLVTAVSMNSGSPLQELELKKIVTADSGISILIALRLLHQYFGSSSSYREFVSALASISSDIVAQVKLESVVSMILSATGKQRMVIGVDEANKYLQRSNLSSQSLTFLLDSQNEKFRLFITSVNIDHYRRESGYSKRSILYVHLPLINIADYANKVLPVLIEDKHVVYSSIFKRKDEFYMACAVIGCGMPKACDYLVEGMKARLSWNSMEAYVKSRLLSEPVSLSFESLMSFVRNTSGVLSVAAVNTRYIGLTPDMIDILVGNGTLATNNEGCLYVPSIALDALSMTWYGSSVESQSRVSTLLFELLQLFRGDYGKAWERNTIYVDCLQREARKAMRIDYLVPGNGVARRVDWQECTLTDAYYPCCHSTLRGNGLDILRFDFTQPRMVRFYAKGELKDMDDATRESSIWYPEDSQNAGYDTVTFLRSVGANPRVVLVLTECRFSDDASSTVLNYKVDVEKKRKLAVVNAVEDLGVKEESIVFRLAAYRANTVEGIHGDVPNVMVADRDAMRGYMGLTLSMVVENMQSLKP